jgi:hypothetical protein
MIELDESGTEDEAHGRRGLREFFYGAKGNVFLPRSLYLSEIDIAVVGDFVALSGFDAENAGEMAGIVAGNFGSSTSHLVNKEPAAHTILYSS